MDKNIVYSFIIVKTRSKGNGTLKNTVKHNEKNKEKITKRDKKKELT